MNKFQFEECRYLEKRLINFIKRVIKEYPTLFKNSINKNKILEKVSTIMRGNFDGFDVEYNYSEITEGFDNEDFYYRKKLYDKIEYFNMKIPADLKKMKDLSIFPDLSVHSRGKHNYNFLIIEICDGYDVAFAHEKIKNYVNSIYCLKTNYLYGALIMIDEIDNEIVINIEWYYGTENIKKPYFNVLNENSISGGVHCYDIEPDTEYPLIPFPSIVKIFPNKFEIGLSEDAFFISKIIKEEKNYPLNILKMEKPPSWMEEMDERYKGKNYLYCEHSLGPTMNMLSTFFLKIIGNDEWKQYIDLFNDILRQLYMKALNDIITWQDIDHTKDYRIKNKDINIQAQKKKFKKTEENLTEIREGYKKKIVAAINLQVKKLSDCDLISHINANLFDYVPSFIDNLIINVENITRHMDRHDSNWGWRLGIVEPTKEVIIKQLNFIKKTSRNGKIDSFWRSVLDDQLFHYDISSRPSHIYDDILRVINDRKFEGIFAYNGFKWNKYQLITRLYEQVKHEVDSEELLCISIYISLRRIDIIDGVYKRMSAYLNKYKGKYKVDEKVINHNNDIHFLYTHLLIDLDNLFNNLRLKSEITDGFNGKNKEKEALISEILNYTDDKYANNYFDILSNELSGYLDSNEVNVLHLLLIIKVLMSINKKISSAGKIIILE